MTKDLRIRFPKLKQDCGIIRVDSNYTICTAKLTPDQLSANPEVEILPPAQ